MFCMWARPLTDLVKFQDKESAWISNVSGKLEADSFRLPQTLHRQTDGHALIELESDADQEYMHFTRSLKLSFGCCSRFDKISLFGDGYKGKEMNRNLLPVFFIE